MIPEVRALKLSNGGFALVDASDYPTVLQYTWWGSQGYVVRALPRQGQKNSPLQSLHVFLLGEKEGHEIDHKNGSGLDCTRGNLRFVTHSFNLANRPKPKGKYTSKFKGVSWHKQKGRWRATIKVNYRQLHLGLFFDEVQAAEAYNKAALDFFGESANLNAI
jgi:hypothetical protein